MNQLVGVVVTAGLVAGSYTLDARRNRYIKTVQNTAEWLRTADVLAEPIPREWSDALQDSETRDLMIEWIFSRPEIDAIETHIAEGVKLRKHLSPVDPRRRTMQVEIEARRSKRDALVGLREHRADTITETVQAYLAKQKLAREAELERVREAREEQQERDDYQRRLREISATEQQRIKTHERIEDWFDREQ